ncbi:MAG: SMP-30/gluconolactonase/LRE family protein [Solirubrobacterales bacterium]
MTAASEGIRFEAESILECANELGEGPVWDAARELLIWVDIFAGTVESLDRDGRHDRRRYEGQVAAIAPRRGGGAVIAVERRLLAIDDDGTLLGELAAVEEDLPDNRFNDCRCDPQGRLWAGTLSRIRNEGDGCLYMFDGERPPRPMVTGTTISNGIGWDPGGGWMYFVDSLTQRLDAYEFDPADGSLGERRTVAEIDPERGLPDGLAVDAEGGVWLAMFGGGTVDRFSPEGEVEAVIELPVANPTCPAFGGPSLETLYVTSSIHREPPEYFDPSPLGGALFACEPGVAGAPVPPFAG